MEPTAASLLRAVGEECQSLDARRGTQGLWLWEQRLTLRSDSNQRHLVQLDGGLRLEGPLDAKFVVAADPAQLVDSRASGPPEARWASLATLLQNRLTAELTRAGGVGTISGRTRLLVAPSGVWVEQVVSAVVPSAGSDRSDSGRQLAAATGRVVLAPRAAGWLAHELGHRAIEGGRRDWPPELTLIDDPTQATWPTGFAIDDEGNTGKPIDLRHGAAFRRRASVREWAVPSMSFTRLDSTRAPFDLARCGYWGVDRIRAGRYDVVTDSVLLESDQVYWSDRATGTEPIMATALLVITSKALSTLTKVAGKGEIEVSTALCTRHESLIPVMVGAPTITLDCVQLIPLNSPKGQGNPGVQRR